MIEHILLPYDGSAPADQALDKAADLAASGEILVTVLTVFPILYRDWWITHNPLLSIEYDEDGAKEIAEDAARRLRDRRVKATARIELGDPADAIINLAHQLKPDIIIMGCRGRSKLADWIIGNVANKALYHAPCSVMLVR